jgi:hypothetical protein
MDKEIKDGGLCMETVFTIIGQDLGVAKKAVEDNDFNLINIIGNRIMTNVFAADKNEIMIIGWLVKELGSELHLIKQKKDDKLEEIKKYSVAYLNELGLEISRKTVDPKTYWQKFFAMETKIRKNIISNHERSIYDKQAEFSKYFAMNMLYLFYSNKNMLLIENNTLSSCVTNELSRNFNEHEGLEALIIYLVLRAFDNYYKYLYFEKFFIKDADAIERGKICLDDYIENIYKLKSLIAKGDTDELFKESNKIISKLGVDYRLYYLIYRDYSRIYIQEGVQEDEDFELSQETKQKIGGIITASLQEKLK